MPRVRCYAGTSYPERPIAFEWEGVWREVAELLRQTRTPEGLAFDVLTKDRQRFRLEWHQVQDDWRITRTD